MCSLFIEFEYSTRYQCYGCKSFFWKKDNIYLRQLFHGIEDLTKTLESELSLEEYSYIFQHGHQKSPIPLMKSALTNKFGSEKLFPAHYYSE